jgi:DNA polymerase-3 subunit epsilon
LADKPIFADVADEFLAFIGSDPLVIHNASFDMAFINAELIRVDRPVIAIDQSIDTLAIARKKFPGAQANLDALCRRFEIDNTHRTLHGALLDADLLARVYIELLGGRQPGLLLDADQDAKGKTSRDDAFENLHFQIDANNIRPIRLHAPTEDELRAHAEFVACLKDPVWNQ